MSGSTKRLTSIIGVAALAAVIAASVMTQNAAAASTKRFVITTEEEILEGGTSGTFVASGAIEGSGTAGQPFGIGMVVVNLRSDAGWINLEPSKGTGRWATIKKFEVTYASGDYADLLGVTVSYREEVGPSHIYRTFRGSIP